jgi:16S rRNA G966 N2-methylase RsmD
MVIVEEDETKEEEEAEEQQKVKTEKYTDKVDPLGKEDYEALRQSLKEHGFLPDYPIIVNSSGDVLDGHHRLKACRELGIEPCFKVQHFDSEIEEELFVYDVHCARRQLSKFQRVQLSLKTEPLLVKLAEQRMIAGKALSRNQERLHVDEQLAKKAKSSKDYVYQCRQIIEAAKQSPDKKLQLGYDTRTYAELLEHVRKEVTPVHRAFRLIKNDQELDRMRAQATEAAKGFSFPADDDSYNNRVRLLNMDCTKITDNEIQDNSVDLILTDPPYVYDPSFRLFKALADMACKKLKPGGSLVFYFGQYQLPEILKVFSSEEYAASDLKYWWMFSVKHESDDVTSMMYTQRVRVQWKPLLWFVKGDSRLGIDYVRDFIQSSTPDKTKHHWAQSQAEAWYIIENLTVSEDSLVVDPFLGSGAFAIPAIKLGRYFIGVEKDKEVYERARSYIAQETVAIGTVAGEGTS